MDQFKKSLIHALHGLRYVLRNERNFKIEVFIGIVVAALVLILELKGWEAIVLILMIMWVLTVEIINTVVERVVDILKPRIHPYARLIKDMMATVVLISSLVSITVGIIIFLPYAREFLGL